MKRCSNYKCDEPFDDGEYETLCPACRYIGRLGWVVGMLTVGAVWGMVKLVLEVVSWLQS
jgi:hypothetical protein